MAGDCSMYAKVLRIPNCASRPKYISVAVAYGLQAENRSPSCSAFQDKLKEVNLVIAILAGSKDHLGRLFGSLRTTFRDV